MVQYPELIEYIREPQYIEYPPRRMDSEWIHSHPEHKWPELEDKPQFFPPDLSQKFSDVEGVCGGVIDGVIVPSLQKGRSVKIEEVDKASLLKVIRDNWFDPTNEEDMYPPWMPLYFYQPSIEDVNTIISHLTEINSIRFRFSADKNRRNETNTYPSFLEECFER